MTRSDAAGPGGGAPAATSLLGFLFDPARCTGCSACALACSTENELGWGTSWRQVIPFNPERRPGVPSFHLSLACNHCEDAPCVTHCPTRAMRRDPDTGAVVVDEDACIGCRYCAWVCPYDAPRFDEARGVMTKCTLCNHRLHSGGEPACVEACPTAALGYGPLEAKPHLPGFPGTDAAPRIRFAPLRRRRPPESSWTLPPEVAAAFAPGARPGRTPPPEGGKGGREPAAPPRGRPLVPVRLTLRGELPLLVFTLGVAGLVGWVAAGALASVTVIPWVFAALAVALLAVSTAHLGHPLRSWRAVAHFPASRLSVEIVAVHAFLAMAFLWLAWGGGDAPRLVPWTPGRGTVAAGGAAATFLGLLALAAVDRVYDPVRAGPRPHSADTLLTGPLVAAALAASPWAYLLFAAPKALLVGRRLPGPDLSSSGLVALRLAALLLPPALWWGAPGLWSGWALLAVAAGEAWDRAAFYRTLEIPGPAREVRRAAAAWPVGGG